MAKFMVVLGHIKDTKRPMQKERSNQIKRYEVAKNRRSCKSTKW